jgi:phage tail-like protein
MPDPATGLRFVVEVQGAEIGSFTGCDGLAAEYEIEEYKEGGENGYVHRIPGRMKYAPVKLTRPIDQSSGQLASWFSRFQTSITRGTACIKALDAKGQAIATWNLVDVYPSKWTGPSFSSDGNQTVKESLELVHNGFLPGAA